MTDTEKLTTTKALIGEDVPSETVSVYLAIAGQKILQKAFPFNPNAPMPSKYDLLQCEIACYLYLKRGAEGETIHNENGVNRTYESASVPDSMLKSVTPFCGY